jgi:hypothetical protein
MGVIGREGQRGERKRYREGRGKAMEKERETEGKR